VLQLSKEHPICCSVDDVYVGPGFNESLNVAQEILKSNAADLLDTLDHVNVLGY
jgi:hypothetical protein